MDNSNCVILVPVVSVLEPETSDALNVLSSRGYTVRFLRGSSQVDLARSTMACQALEDGFTETMWIDADTAFDPDDVDRLRAHDLPIVAGLYLQKTQHRPRFVGKFVNPNVTFGINGGLLEMVYVGMGFTLIRAEVYRKVAKSLSVCDGGYGGKKVIPYFQPMLANEDILSHEGQLTYLSEDYSFCYRAAAAGYEIKADTSVKVGHVGKYVYSWDDFTLRPILDTLKVGNDTTETTTMDAEAILERMLEHKVGEILELRQKLVQLMGIVNDLCTGKVLTTQVKVDLTPGTESIHLTPQTPAMLAALEERDQAIKEYQERQMGLMEEAIELCAPNVYPNL